jgi:hypothetical protein
MFRVATTQNTPRAQAQLGTLSPLAIPAKGLNARDVLALMGPEYAISMVNAMCEPYGLRTRKGYTEWANNLPAAVPVRTMLHYYPATANPPSALSKIMRAKPISLRLFAEARVAAFPPAGKLFAATFGHLYDVTAGGPGPWTAEAGVGAPSAGDYWTWINFQNLAGSFLVACNNDGGYSYYDGAAWHTPVAGAGVGEINGCDPAKFCFVVEYMKRLWFVEKDSTRAWYLPVSQITGTVTEFNFGEQFAHGGHLVALARWTVDAGTDMNDNLVAVSSQGDVVVYQGTDPSTVDTFSLKGVWYVGPLPIGRRSVINTGADVHILSQFGVTPLSRLLTTIDMAQQETMRLTYMISPLIARLMREASNLEGWKIVTIAKEELFLIGIPRDALEFGGQFFGLKISTGGWSLLNHLPYASFTSVDADTFAGTFDGRIVRAFDGPLDNVLMGATAGEPIKCQVTPAYNSMEQSFTTGAQQKVFKMLRPTFISTATPSVSVAILTDYGGPSAGVVPTVPEIAEALWDVDLWDEAEWSGVQDPVKWWIGINGVGFTGTAQIDYICGGDTVLASIDFWTERGGVL